MSEYFTITESEAPKPNGEVMAATVYEYSRPARVGLIATAGASHDVIKSVRHTILDPVSQGV